MLPYVYLPQLDTTNFYAVAIRQLGNGLQCSSFHCFYDQPCSNVKFPDKQIRFQLDYNGMPNAPYQMIISASQLFISGADIGESN